MDDGSQRGPKVPGHEQVLRSLTKPHYLKPSGDRPTSTAFDEDVFSVDRASLTTPAEAASRFRNVTHVAEFNVATAEALGFSTHEELDPDFPDNQAHAHVYFSMMEGGMGRKRAAKRLAVACTLVAVETS
jgi:hypothetical protein